MIPSYEQEVARKRMSARIFWVITFFCATLLYFFFKGYYPSINFSMQDFITGSGKITEVGKDISIRPFGILNVNIKTPGTFAFFSGDTLSGMSYNSGDKKMVDYGKYLLMLEKGGFIQNNIPITIDKTTPFYIDDVTLIPEISYQTFSGQTLKHIAKLKNGSFIGETGSGMVLWDQYFLTGTLIHTGAIRHIGEGYYLSQSGQLITYNTESKSWNPESGSGIRTYIKGCTAPKMQNEKLWCPEKQTLFIDDTHTLTGVTSVGNDYIRQGDKTTIGAITSQNSKNSSILTGSTDSTHITYHDGIWYYTHGSGVLLPIFDTDGDTINTGLDTIEYIDGLHEYLISIGKKNETRYLSIWSKRDPERPRHIEFPDRPLKDIRITEIGRNFYIKGYDFLVFLYRGSDRIHWITDGEIMAVGPDFAIYQKNGEIWQALWRDESVFRNRIR